MRIACERQVRQVSSSAEAARLCTEAGSVGCEVYCNLDVQNRYSITQ